MAGIWDMIHSFFSPEEGFQEAGNVLKDFWQQAQNRQQPFINQGQSMFPGLQGAYGQLLDPEGLLKKWMSGYEMSPYAKQSIANATESGLNAASSQGLLGSSAATQNIQNSANYLMNKDRQAYLNDLMNKYQLGVNLGKDIYGIGANTASDINRTGLEFGRDIAGARGNEINAPGNLLGNILSRAAQIYFQPNINSAFQGAGAAGAFGGGPGGAALSAAA